MNAVYHRGYDVREPVEIRIMHDELVVLSFPGPDRSVRLEKFRVGKAMPRRYRNRPTGEFLREDVVHLTQKLLHRKSKIK